jgi:hypothetical protein
MSRILSRSAIAPAAVPSHLRLPTADAPDCSGTAVFKTATIAMHWFLLITGGAMRSDRSVADNVVVQEGIDDHDPLAKFRRTDDELTFKELLAGKIRVPAEKGEVSFWELMPPSF